MKVTQSQLKTLIRHIVLEAMSKRINRRISEEIEPVIQKSPDHDHQFDDGRTSPMKAVNLSEAGMRTVNSPEVYKQQGFKCGQASKKKDQGLVSNIQSWFNKAIKLESEPYASEARRVYNTAYKEGAGANNPPQYFKEISFGSLFGKNKKQSHNGLDMNQVQQIKQQALEKSQGNKIQAIAMLTQAMNSADENMKDVYLTAIHYIRNSNNNYRQYSNNNGGQRDVDFIGEETGTGAVGGYSTPYAFSAKNKLGSGKAISAAKKYGKVVKSISEKEQ